MLLKRIPVRECGNFERIRLRQDVTNCKQSQYKQWKAIERRNLSEGISVSIVRNIFNFSQRIE